MHKTLTESRSLMPVRRSGMHAVFEELRDGPGSKLHFIKTPFLDLAPEVMRAVERCVCAQDRDRPGP